MADFLEEKRREIEARMDELRPQVDEYHRLEAAAKALAGAADTTSSSSRSTRPLPRRGGGGGGGRAGRPRGSGTRGNQALEIVRGQPGITIPEIAEKMGIQQNYLYRVLPALQKDGLVRKEGRGWHPLEAA